MTKIYQNERLLLLAFLVALVIQISFSYRISSIKPDIRLIEEPPNNKLIKTLAFGDDQFLFRAISLILQNTGDVFAGFVPLKNYSYKNLYDWFILLDELDSKSDLIPSLSVNYYSYTQKKTDLIYLINYLEQHSENNFKKKWWWMVQAFIMAKNYYKDNNLALELALKISKNRSDDMPLWTKQLPAFVYDDIGEDCMAFQIIKNIMDGHDQNIVKISPREMDFMKYYIKKIIYKLKESNFNPNKCSNYKKK